MHDRAKTLVGLLLCWSLTVAAQPATNPCGSIANAYGPYDYRTERGGKLAIVEQYHFKPHVEALLRLPGMSGVSLGGDIDYTLRASPNHHRALVAMTRYGERLKLPKVPGADYTVACYFDRAIRFAPDDLVVRMLFASWLGRQGEVAAAEGQLDFVGRHAAVNALTLHNAGLVYMELKQYEKALEYDHRAKALGYARKDLEEKLRAAGQWRDPSAAASQQQAASAAPAASSVSSTPPSRP